jgi:hypothetical protein
VPDQRMDWGCWDWEGVQWWSQERPERMLAPEGLALEVVPVLVQLERLGVQQRQVVLLLLLLLLLA